MKIKSDDVELNDVLFYSRFFVKVDVNSSVGVSHKLV